ncbi:uncharacterized protein LOC111024204 isoform X2 [Momordica charantia]|uniref:Uncharacterized protein LOC111024204 isoform X2 n=1 Tax=Momordica charantia TaxID=3673 RepID=A0A6J1DTD3_MOMCH|nr:uncharacterized protein LOC111024204 isoform X2 [Momordica charantia]
MGRLFASCFGFCSSKNGKQRNRDQQSTIQFQTNPIPSHPLLEAGRDGSLDISPMEEVNCVKPHDQYVVLSYEEADSVHGKKQDKREMEASAAKASKPESSSEDIAVSLSPSFTSSCPPTHRYRNCKDSDDEDEVFDSHDENEMVESISSVANSSAYVCGSNRKKARHRTAYICPVRNPVENLSQWNVVKSKGALPPTPQKENLKLEQESTSSKSKAFKSSKEPSVDASLSNWLASSESTPVGPITTTMALEDTVTPPVKSSTLQGSSSPGRSSRNEMPEASDEDHDSASSFKGIPNTTSKYREDKTVNWHSTPFETRLERALNNRGVAKA